MNKIFVGLLCCVSFSSFAATSTFKVIKNDYKDYGEESIQMKTDKGNLSIYASNLPASTYKTLASFKKGQCFSMSSPNDFIKSEGYISVDSIKAVKKVACK